MQSFIYRLMKETQVQFDETQLSECFPLNKVSAGYLKHPKQCSALHSSRSRRREKTAHGQARTASGNSHLHKSVVTLSIWNEEAMDGDFLGHLSLDLIQQEGEKTTHATSL
jgi:metallopeptidase MepB